MVEHLKRMMDVSDEVGSIKEIDMGPWADRCDRISIRGKTGDGRAFEMFLEIDFRKDSGNVDG